MVYSDVINNKDFFMEHKEKYTMKDVNNLIIYSLFRPYRGRTLSEKEAKFVCKCWAIHFGTEYSKTISKS